MTRRTFEAGEDETPVWSPDGAFLAFASAGAEPRTLFRLGIDGRGEAEAFWQDPRHFHAADWSPDGAAILLDVQDPDTNGDVYLLELEGDRNARSRPAAACSRSGRATERSCISGAPTM